MVAQAYHGQTPAIGHGYRGSANVYWTAARFPGMLCALS
jgi:hypothetical protein